MNKGQIIRRTMTDPRLVRALPGHKQRLALALSLVTGQEIRVSKEQR